MEFKPATSRLSVARSNHWATVPQNREMNKQELLLTAHPSIETASKVAIHWSSSSVHEDSCAEQRPSSTNDNSYAMSTMCDVSSSVMKTMCELCYQNY